MRTPSERELLALWESGLTRHPIDRALLLCAWARPDVPGNELAHLPLGAVNEALLRLRRALFGPRLQAQVACERCGEALEIGLSVDELLPASQGTSPPPVLQLEGFELRLPDSADLASAAGMVDARAAAEQLLERCCLPRSPETVLSDEVRARIEAWLEASDPLADLRLQLSCEACGHEWTAALDPASWLWDEVQRSARHLLAQVHALARAYGWTEPQVLALTPQRRSIYLDMVQA
jgi:hypothetical protein